MPCALYTSTISLDRPPSCPVATTIGLQLLYHSMSSPLPSFVELMSSLGLEDGPSLPCGPRAFLRPRSHSNASSSSDIDDEHDLPHQRYANAGTYLFVSSSDYDRRDQYTNSLDTDNPRLSRQGKGRYSPYPTAAVSWPSLDDCPFKRFIVFADSKERKCPHIV
jgi:hypothetical protein